MPKKAKSKRGRTKNLLVEEKKKALQKLWDLFETQQGEYVSHLNSSCQTACHKIHKMYDDKLKSLPEDIRNMTLSEYMEMQRKDEPQISNVNNLRAITSEFSKTKLLSEKKTQKKNKTERKRSVSVCSTGKGGHQNLLSSASRVLSDSCLSTPYNKRSVVPSYVITPKFNPNVPLSKGCMRKPRAGEIILSTSGSPLQNFVDDVALSLGGGKIIKITEDTEIVKLENDFMKKLDADTKSTIENVKKKLDKILQS